MEKTAFDGLDVYCKKLGHPVPFSYCRAPGSAVYCSHIKDCWFSKIPDIKNYIGEHFTAEEIQQAEQPSAPKMLTLLELIEKAKKNS
jgi:hypothetical protein